MTSPRLRRIAGTPIELTELGFGGSAIGNLYRETAPPDAGHATRS